MVLGYLPAPAAEATAATTAETTTTANRPCSNTYDIPFRYPYSSQSHVLFYHLT